MRSPQIPLGVIVGPTASGKSDLAMALAGNLPLEILVADSRQVYRGMTIGTAKPDAAARRRVRHHLLDLAASDQPFSVADWLAAARQAAAEVTARGALPLVVGGTGLYVNALLDGYDLGAAATSPELRARLAVALARDGVARLAEELTELDPDTARRTDLRNPRRVVRALERAHLHGGAAPLPRSAAWEGPVAMLGLRRPRAVLDRRIDRRAAELFASGLLDEVRSLLAAGHAASLPPMTGHGYAESVRHLAGEWSLEHAIEVTAQRTRQYARRQEAWYKRDPRVRWLEVGEGPADAPSVVDEALRALAAVAPRPPAVDG